MFWFQGAGLVFLRHLSGNLPELGGVTFRWASECLDIAV